VRNGEGTSQRIGQTRNIKRQYQRGVPVTLKRLLIGCFVGVLLLSIAVGAIAAPKTIVIKLSHGDAADGSYGTAENGAITFKRLVEARSDGRIKVEIYPNCQLGSEREMYESVIMGTTQMTWCSSAPISGWVPEMMVLSIPYLFSGPEVAYKVLDGQFGRELSDLVIKKAGMRFLSYSHIGFRHFTNNVRPIRSPKDMKGLKIRTREDPAEMKIVQSLGASPTPIAWGELYTALQQGVVDGEENPTSMIQVSKLYEVQKYLTLDGHVFGVNPVTINEKFYQSLPQDLKLIVADSAKTAALAYRGMLEYGNAIDLEDLSKKGMQIYSPTTAELAEFKAATQGPVKSFVAGKIGNAWVDKLMNAVAAADKEYAAEIK
jgi:C4-dicarboxylate-binding protein DctP